MCPPPGAAAADAPACPAAAPSAPRRQQQLDYMNKLQAELLAHRQAILQMYSMPHPE
jgi:hypothetical protein